MAWFQRTHRGWERAKAATHNIKQLPPHTQLAGWSSGDQMVYQLSPAYMEIGQGGVSPIRGWGMGLLIPAMLFGAYVGMQQVWYSVSQLWAPRLVWDANATAWTPGINWWELLLGTPVGLFLSIFAGLLTFVLFYTSFISVTDATVRFDHQRQKVWMWTNKGPIEMAWAKLVPRVESSVATAYATVKTYRGQYAELASDGSVKVSHGIPHVFQIGQISAAEDGVRPGMEYVRRYMELGHQAVQQPEKLLSHRPRWYAMVNLAGMADDWVRWRENRDKPGVAPAPWIRTTAFTLLFPLFFPLQFTNWLALVVAPRPKWPKELDALHQADKLQFQSQTESNANRQLVQTENRAVEATYPRRKPVIRVNGEIVGGDEKL